MRKLILFAVLLALLQACSRREAVRPPVDVPKPADAPRIEVVYCRLAPSKEIVDVQVRLHGMKEIAADPADTYLIDEGTGGKYYLMILRRIGRLAEIRNPEEAAVHSLMFRNPYGKLKPGTSVTLVVGGMRQQHVIVEK